MNHPNGTAYFNYSNGITDETILENLLHDQQLVEIVFVAADEEVSATFAIKSLQEKMRLEFESDSSLPFRMNTGWRHYWNYDDNHLND